MYESIEEFDRIEQVKEYEWWISQRKWRNKEENGIEKRILNDSIEWNGKSTSTKSGK